jgi:hypothetical protein
MSDQTPLSDYRYHADQLLIALELDNGQEGFLGVGRHLIQLAEAAGKLSLPAPLEFFLISDDCRSGPARTMNSGFSIRFPDGSHIRGESESRDLLEKLVEHRTKAVVALRQWGRHLHYWHGPDTPPVVGVRDNPPAVQKERRTSASGPTRRHR